MKSKSDQPSTRWKCSHCEKEFKYNSERLRHEQSHVAQFQCQVCLKKFTFVSALRRHEKQHQRSSSVQCDICNGKFKDATLLKRHMQYAHKGTFTCKKCTVTFHSESALHTHMKTHRPENERKYRCSFAECGKSFNFAHHLKHHELTHTDIKQHFCSTCGKGFIQLNHLKIHQKSHEPENWLPCLEPNCKKLFTNEYARRRHYVTHKNKCDSGISSDSSTTGDTVSLKTNKVLCRYCGKLVSRQGYAKHSIKCSPMDSTNKEEGAYKCEQETLQQENNNVLNGENEVRDNATIGQTNDLSNENKSNVALDKGENDVGTCKSVLGCCIVTGSPEIGPSCLCAQMISENELYQKPDNETDVVVSTRREGDGDLKTTDNPQYAINCPKADVKLRIAYDRSDNIETTNNEMNICDGCDCAKTCPSNPKNRIQAIQNKEMPELEYRNDGVIKIKEAFDLDLSVDIKCNQSNVHANPLPNNKTVSEVKEVAKFVPFNSCKDILGNCIVSGNGTMGEGCLCARMSLYDQQISEQQIDEITPCPNSEFL